MWNYRMQLTVSVKKNIIDISQNLFKYEPNSVKIWNNSRKNELQNILLDIFDRLINEGKTNDDKSLGALIILSSLVCVSSEAALSLPHLNQSIWINE